jgi:hypothetical protein
MGKTKTKELSSERWSTFAKRGTKYGLADWGDRVLTDELPFGNTMFSKEAIQMNVKERKFTFAEVSKAAGIPNTLLNQWAARGKFVMSDADRVDVGKGVARELSYYTMLQIIVMGELTKFTVPLDLAQRVAATFSHTGDESRDLGDLFKGGKTFISVTPGAAVEHCLFKVEPNQPFDAAWAKLQPNVIMTSALLIDMNDLLMNAMSALGEDWTWVLDRENAE